MFNKLFAENALCKEDGVKGVIMKKGWLFTLALLSFSLYADEECCEPVYKCECQCPEPPRFDPLDRDERDYSWPGRREDQFYDTLTR